MHLAFVSRKKAAEQFVIIVDSSSWRAFVPDLLSPLAGIYFLKAMFPIEDLLPTPMSPVQICHALYEAGLALKLMIATHRPFADSVDQDQTAQNVQSDLESTLSDKEIFLSRN